MHVHRLSGAAALTLFGAAVIVACSDNTTAPLTGIYAHLTADQEVTNTPFTSGSGDAKIDATSQGGTMPKVTSLTWTGLTGAPTRISIQSGVGTANGAAIADICGNT